MKFTEKKSHSALQAKQKSKNGQFGDFWKTEATVQTVLPDMAFFKYTKNGGKYQNWKTSNETIKVIFKHCEIFLPMKCQNDGLKLGR